MEDPAGFFKEWKRTSLAPFELIVDELLSLRVENERLKEESKYSKKLQDRVVGSLERDLEKTKEELSKTKDDLDTALEKLSTVLPAYKTLLASKLPPGEKIEGVRFNHNPYPTPPDSTKTTGGGSDATNGFTTPLKSNRLNVDERRRPGQRIIRDVSSDKKKASHGRPLSSRTHVHVSSSSSNTNQTPRSSVRSSRDEREVQTPGLTTSRNLNSKKASSRLSLGRSHKKTQPLEVQLKHKKRKPQERDLSPEVGRKTKPKRKKRTPLATLNEPSHRRGRSPPEGRSDHDDEDDDYSKNVDGTVQPANIRRSSSGGRVIIEESCVYMNDSPEGAEEIIHLVPQAPEKSCNSKGAFDDETKTSKTSKPSRHPGSAGKRKERGGVAYKYQETVRKRDERALLEAFECVLCRRYFEKLELTPVQLKERLNNVGRHRHVHKPEEDLEGFWDPDFPATQDDAAQQHLMRFSRPGPLKSFRRDICPTQQPCTHTEVFTEVEQKDSEPPKWLSTDKKKKKDTDKCKNDDNGNDNNEQTVRPLVPDLSKRQSSERIEEVQQHEEQQEILESQMINCSPSRPQMMLDASQAIPDHNNNHNDEHKLLSTCSNTAVVAAIEQTPEFANPEQQQSRIPESLDIF